VNKSARIRKLLNEAPSTIGELAILTGWSKRTAHVAVWVLKNRGQAVRIGKVPHVRDSPGGRQFLNLYALTPHGEALHRKDRRIIP
jgi:hypothetical protein